MAGGPWARRAAAYLCAALTVTSALGAPPAGVLRQLARGQLRLAHQALLPQLSAAPDDPDLMGALGAIYARAGCAADADAAFRLAAGSAWVEERALPLWADALRDLGAVDEAATLRAAALLTPGLHPGREAQVWTERAEDELERGRWRAAAAHAEQAIAWYPGGALPWAARARVAAEAGDRGAAEEALWIAARLADRPIALAALTEAALLAADGLYIEADALLQAQPTARGSDSRLWALRAQIARQRGDPAAAIRMLEDERFHWSAEPRLEEERVRALWAVGADGRATQALAQASARAPGSRRLADLRLEADLRADLAAGDAMAAAARWRRAVAADPENDRRAALGRALGLR